MDKNGEPLVVVTQDATYKDVVNLGMSGEEIAAIFNPWFYRVIAAPAKTTWDQIQMYAAIGACLLAGYIIYILATGNFTLPPLPPHPPVPSPTGAAP